MRRKHLSSDRLLGVHAAAAGSVSQSDLPDLIEEDVWTAAGAATIPSSSSSSSSAGDRSRRLLSSGLEHHRKHVGGLSLVFESGYEAAWDHGAGRTTAEVAISAPVGVPEWGRMVLGRAGLPEKASGSTEEEWVPPHEYLERSNGKTTAATSVFEGAGRTLKGRDLSRVRDAVWSWSGFFG